MPTIDDELNSLDDGVRRLKIEYDVYFGGGSKKPPADLEWRVQSLIKKYADGRSMNYAQRFRYNTITQKYAFSIAEFCEAHDLCRATFYNLEKIGKAPRIMQVGKRRLISQEAAAEWRRDREVAK